MTSCRRPRHLNKAIKTKEKLNHEKVFYRVLALSVPDDPFPVHAYAYLDPSVMTYTVQIVAGVVIAAGAVIGILWRRAKKKVQDKLGIDENAKKEVEEDVIAYEDTDS